MTFKEISETSKKLRDALSRKKDSTLHLKKAEDITKGLADSVKIKKA